MPVSIPSGIRQAKEGTLKLKRFLTELRQERKQIDEVIMSVERLAMSRGRRGRPPAWLAKENRRLVRSTSKKPAAS